jgi:hypothetical protein
MTEAEWLECKDPKKMLEFLGGKVGDRKDRLLSLAFCRRYRSLLTDHRSQMAFEVVERLADGLANHNEVVAAIDATLHALQDTEAAARRTYVEDDGKQVVFFPSFVGMFQFSRGSSEWDQHYNAHLGSAILRFFPPQNVQVERPAATEHIAQAILVLDIFGNPFRPVLIDPKCLTPTVTSLAAAAYEERSLPSGELDPTRLAVLADALEEAGCQDQSVLDHLRSPGPHVRGCWPLDLILGRA